MKPKKCRSCREPFKSYQPLQIVCSPRCAMAYAAKQAEAKREKEARARRKQTREQLEALKPRSKLLAEAQAAFNAWVRERDANEPCISCDRFHEGQWHASHYRSVGACSSLRFDPDNVHKACSPCNSHLSGNLIEYRIRLEKKIGPERLARLESAPKVRRWTDDELRKIKTDYTAATRALRRLKAA